MYSKPKQGSSLIPFLKIFKVDFENYEPYIPMSGETDEENKKEEEEKKEEETEEEDEESSNEEEEKPFDWQLGEILEEYYYGKFTSIDYEFDYEGISSSLNIKPPMLVDGIRFYKGVQGQFDFHQMKRSKILEEMIKTAGLEPEVDPTGLIDDVIDYTNVKKSDTSSGADSDSADLNQLVKNAIKGKKGKREKAEAVHNALRDSCIKYRGYNDFQYNTVKDCWEHRQNPGLNCGDTSQLTVGAMKIAGLSAETLLTFDSAHYITRIEGQWFSDLVWSEGNCSQRPFDETWNGYRDGSPHPSPSG